MLDNNSLKPVEGLDKYVRTLYEKHFVFYKRTKKYAHCLCSECGKEYTIRTEGTGDMFEDSCMDIYPIPQRDSKTICPKCKKESVYKPAGVFKTDHRYRYFVIGQKLSETEFVFRIYYSWRQTIKNNPSNYNFCEEKRIYLQKGKKPERFYKYAKKWGECTHGELFSYCVHPSTFEEIQKTEMFKYVPEYPKKEKYNKDSWVMDFYIAAARYPDMEMILKNGMYQLADNLINKAAVNFNPRGKTIYDRLRINKNRMKDLINQEGAMKPLMIYQMERRSGVNWKDEELRFIELLWEDSYGNNFSEILKYTTPTKLKNYFKKMKIDINENDDYKKRNSKHSERREYYDYIRMRRENGYDMTNSIYLFPKDIHLRHNEMVLEKEKANIDKRIEEVNKKFTNIAKKYKQIARRYSAAAGGLIIRPAKNAGEIVLEGRVLHHCVGGDNYLQKHNSGSSYILFLRKADNQDIPFVTVEIHDEKIFQWYGAYDSKPEEKMIDAWLKAYTKELTQRRTEKKKAKTA